MAELLRIGLIGAGGNTQSRHIPGFRALPDVQVTGVVNRSRQSSERVATEFGIPRVYESVDALLADPAIDAVCIGTWPYRHRDFTVAALAAGKHVLCEARMAMDASEAVAMLRASQAHPGLVAQLVPAPFDLRLGPTIARLISEGLLGDVTEVKVTVLNGSGLDPAQPLHWRHRADYSGHNIMTLGIFFEIAQRWLGDITRVVADGVITIPERVDPETGRPRAVDIPDTFSVLGRLARGGRITFHVSNVSTGGPWSGIVVHGTRATLRWTLDDTATWARHGEPFAELQPDPGTALGWRVEQDFVESIRTGAPVRYTSFEDGVRYMRVTTAAWTSWREGRAVDIAA